MYSTDLLSFLYADVGQRVSICCLSPDWHRAPQEHCPATHLHCCTVIGLFFLPDIFQRVFAADGNYLENHEEITPSFWESLVRCLASTDPPILNAEEKNNVSYYRNMQPLYELLCGCFYNS